MIRTLRSCSRLGAYDEAVRSPTAQAAAISKLGDDKMKEFLFVPILDYCTTPRRVAIGAIIRRVCDIGVIVTSPSGRRSEIKPATVVSPPTMVTFTEAFRSRLRADAVEATVIVGIA